MNKNIHVHSDFGDDIHVMGQQISENILVTHVVAAYAEHKVQVARLTLRLGELALTRITPTSDSAGCIRSLKQMA
jgi:hypothetical protein